MALQKFILLVIGGSILATMAIVFIFIIINICLRYKATKYHPKPMTNVYSLSNSEKKSPLFNFLNQDVKAPPLPSREQFEMQSDHSYEDMNPVVDTTTVSQDGSSPPHLFTREPTISHQLETRIDIQDHQDFSTSFKEKNQKNQPVDLGSYEAVSSIPDYLDLDQSKDVQVESDLDYDDVVPVETMSLDYDDAVPVETMSLDYDDVVPVETMSLDYDDAVPVATISLEYEDVLPADTVSEDYDEVG